VEIQNIFIDLLAAKLRKIISDEIKNAKCFSVIVDSTQNLTKN